MTDTKAIDVLAFLDAALALQNEQRFQRAKFFRPYPKQALFLAAGFTFRERLLMAGNQLGKTETGAFETYCHLTGRYPDWWLGQRWSRPIRMWICGESSTVCRDVQQKKLCGTPGVDTDFGTGYIPKDDFVERPSLSRGVTDAFDTMQVKHHRWNLATKAWEEDGVSTAGFKSYEQGRLKFQGEPVDLIWLDEEPPMDIYSECLTRTTATGGKLMMTFTPLKGKSEVVIRFLDEENPGRHVTTMTIYDAKHMTDQGPEALKAIIAAWPAHERDARARGIPLMGSGRVFPFVDEMLMEPALEHIPTHWVKLWGIDFGIGHPFAAVLILWDKDNDCIHVHATVRVADGLPIIHAAAIKPIGAAVPVAWPQDGTAREKGTGETLAALYKKTGLMMLADHATWPDGGISTEAGILEMAERMQTGRLKVASHLADWFDEFRQYHRKDGLIVKVRDDLMSATRIAIMAKRHARLVPLGSLGGKRYQPEGRNEIARGTDFNPFDPSED
jgi:phage terminase large subunit-like protein